MYLLNINRVRVWDTTILVTFVMGSILLEILYGADKNRAVAISPPTHGDQILYTMQHLYNNMSIMCVY